MPAFLDLLIVLVSYGFTVSSLHPEASMNSTQLITYNGYTPERHFVTTNDGYILQMFRIKPESDNRPVVFIQHGLSGSSDCWLLNGNWGSFPFILTDAGFDVWLGNVRGNIYSMNHTTLPVKSHRFWNFTFEEMAERDLPAMIDRVLEVTKEEKLFYVGHSQGTEMAFIGLSINKTLASKVKLFTAFAPIARISHVKGLLNYLAHMELFDGLIYKLFGNHQFLASSEVMDLLRATICTADAITRGLCETKTSLICGFDISNINKTRLDIWEAHYDQSTSTKNMIHFAQLIQQRRIQKFDYGSPAANMVHYNQTTPPPYNISTLTVPTVLVTGGNDWLGDPRDVSWLTETLYKTIQKIIFIDKYNHGDYLAGKDAPSLVYEPVMRLMKSYL